MTILDKIIVQKRLEIARQQEAVSLEKLQSLECMSRHAVSFQEALLASDTGIIAEFKRKSPSKGWIHPGADPETVVPLYEQGGATACSVLTDHPFFGGSLGDLHRVRPLVNLPLLRKDFIIDAYQLYQAKAVGADFVLLIAAALSAPLVEEFAGIAHTLGLEVLLEIHTEEELECLCPAVDVVGVNNRNLKTFVTDVNTSFELGEKIPPSFVKISESGISSPGTVRSLRQAGFRGFLMGENFMKEAEPGKALAAFIQALKEPGQPTAV